MKRSPDKRDVLVITGGFLLLHLLTGRDWCLYVAAIALLMGWVHPLSRTWLLKAWYGLAMVLGAISSRVVLTVVYFVVLCPLALLHNIWVKNKYNLPRKPLHSTLLEVEETVDTAFFERPW